MDLFRMKIAVLASTFLIGLMPAFLTGAQAQTASVSGVVLDQHGEPLIGAAVMVEGTTRGVVTGLDGDFALEASASEILNISCIGFVTASVPATPGQPMRIVLQEDTQLLDEVVVVGYGVQRKSDITGAIASIGTDDLKNQATDNVGKAIQGKVAGVQVLQLSGAPGEATHFRVRGYSSNSGTTEPLYLVDGLKVDDISYLNSENIKSIEILKDAASAAIYGAEAGNGVVLITTNSGSDGQTRIFYNGQYALQQVSHKIDMLNAAQFKKFWMDAGYSADSFQNGDTDWQDTMFGNGYLTQHTVGVEGGNDKGKFFVSLNYLRNDGVVVLDNDTNDRFTAQVNASYQIRPWLNVGTTNSIEYRFLKRISQSDNEIAQGLIGAAYLYDPTVPIVYADDADAPAALLQAEADGHYVMRDENGRLYGTSLFGIKPGNPFGEMYRRISQERRFNINGTIYANVTPTFLPGLVYTSRLGYRLGTSDGHTYEAPHWWNTSLQSDIANYNGGTHMNTYLQWENFGNYSVDFTEKSHLNAMLGMQFTRIFETYTTGAVSGLISTAENFHNFNAQSAGASVGLSGEPAWYANMSYFARLGYTYENKYIFNTNFRADAYDLSRLSKKNRWGFFPSASLGWVVSNERFMDSVKTALQLSHFKIRGSWGINGNVNSLSGYQWASSMILNHPSVSNQPGSNYSFKDKLITGAAPASLLANEDLNWEESAQFDAGVELRFFRDMLGVNVDWYHKVTTNLLTLADAPNISGASQQWVNMGKILNRGVDLELSWKQSIGDFNYSLAGNMSFLHNEVLESPYGDGRYDGGGGWFTSATYFEKGYPIWYFRTNIVEHIDNMTGMPVYKTAQELGTDDGKAYVGSAIPDFTYGLTLTAAYKGFDLRVFGNGQQGNKLFWAIARLNPQTMYANMPKAVIQDYWSWTNTDGKRAGAQVWAGGAALIDYGSSDHMVFDASYFAIKEIQLGYTLPKRFAGKLGLQSLRLYGSMDNWFIFTKYPGTNPDTMAGLTEGDVPERVMGMRQNGGMGVDRFQYPSIRQLVFGVNVSF